MSNSYAISPILEHGLQFPLPLGDRLGVYIMPSAIVATYVQTSHQQWLARSKKDGTARRDSSMRKFFDPEEHYREA